MRQLVYTIFISNNRVSFHLWWIENLLKHQKVSKYFESDCSNCKCECDKSCDVGEYLDYANCKCKKNLTDKLVKECSENIDKNEMISLTLNAYKNA